MAFLRQGSAIFGLYISNNHVGEESKTCALLEQAYIYCLFYFILFYFIIYRGSSGPHMPAVVHFSARVNKFKPGRLLIGTVKIYIQLLMSL